jgi:hypothetical protein
MANFSIKFYDKDDRQISIECFATNDDSIRVIVENGSYELIDLDKSTAIKFAKTLRTEINKIENE